MTDNHDDDNGERRRKRRVIENETGSVSEGIPGRDLSEMTPEDVFRALLHEELELEIGLRTRLKETIESRLAWALVLRDALENHFAPPEGREDKDGPNQFADLALAAYKATNASAELFFPTERPAPLSVIENQAPLKASDPGRSPVQELHRPPRHAARPQIQLHHEDRIVKEPNKFLYLRDVTATPTMVYEITCPDCHRSDFPRLQGLLNHCRLKHHREFGSHDECVQACAVVVPEEEQAYVVQHGLEVLGMSASLQRLFKMAVGSYEGIVSVPAVEGEERPAETAQSRLPIKTEEEEREEAAFVTKTLGHHKDTPALAPFLGRAPRKRQIHVYDDAEPLDIVNVGDKAPSRDRALPCRERCRAQEYMEDAVKSQDKLESVLDPELRLKHVLKMFEGSRFHIPIRLIVSDYSLRLPNEATKQEGIASHKWMISVTTASYSLHISTVLAKMSVTCTGPATACVVPLSVSNPPFCVLGTSDRQFLAQVTLEWVGSRNKPTQLDHWVQLHEGKSTRPVKGDEQILDIELDRHTEVIPRRNDTWKVDWSVGTGGPPNDGVQLVSVSKTAGRVEPDHIQRLKKIVQRFPMTAQDAGSRKIPEVPYFLPLTTQHSLSLVEGRRKAIEWGRARAVWEALIPEREKDKQETQSSDNVVKISGPVDVYRWMKAEGHFPGSTSESGQSSKVHKPLTDIFCAFCGLRPSTHRKGKTGRAKNGDDGGSGRLCEQPSWVGKMPIVDVQGFLAHQPETVRQRVVTEPFTRFALAQLLGKTDPALILGIERVISVLRLPCFPLYPVPLASSIVPRKEQRETEVAPFAVLAASVQHLIRLLVCGGFQAMDNKSEGSKQVIAQFNGSHGSKRRLLVPVHIIRGLVEGARRRGSRDIHRMVLLSMARLGVVVHDVTHDAQLEQAHPDFLVQGATTASDQGHT